MHISPEEALKEKIKIKRNKKERRNPTQGLLFPYMPTSMTKHTHKHTTNNNKNFHKLLL